MAKEDQKYSSEKLPEAKPAEEQKVETPAAAEAPDKTEEEQAPVTEV